MILPLGQPRAFEPGQEPRIWWVRHRNSNLAPERSPIPILCQVRAATLPAAGGPCLFFSPASAWGRREMSCPSKQGFEPFPKL